MSPEEMNYCFMPSVLEVACNGRNKALFEVSC
jgi:hypothetical protein